MKNFKLLILLFSLLLLSACGSVMLSATSGMANNLSAAILNQDDPDIVRDGAPAFLLMLDSFIEAAPDDISMLSAAAELYAAYGVLFVDDQNRAHRLTSRSLGYSQRSLCASNQDACAVESMSFPQFEEMLDQLNNKDVVSLYSFGMSWMAYIKVHSGDWSALAKLPRVAALLKRVQALDADYQAVQVEHFLAVLNTIRPPALGGDFESGKAHYERALSLSQGKDLSINVDYARYYARTLYDRELHDRLLKEVIAAEPSQHGYTLFNTMAQDEAIQLLESAEDYF